MLQHKTVLTIADNSGVLEGRCLNIQNKKYAYCGDKILISVTKVKSLSTHKPGDLVDAVPVRTAKVIPAYDGRSFLFLNDNAAILLTQKKAPLARRISGPVSTILRKKGFFRVLSIASTVV